MLKKQMIQQFMTPKKIQRAFINYLAKNEAKINQDKTIAYTVLNDARNIGGERVVDFFTGQNLPIATNIEGDFVRPESEHLLIYKIRLYVAPGDDLETANYNRGSSGNIAYNNSVIDVYNNGVRMLKNIPIADFIQENTSSINDRGTLTLDEPILWQGQTPFLIQLKDKSGLTYATGVIRFDLVGIGLI